jgi:branched-subunit amino acid permease
VAYCTDGEEMNWLKAIWSFVLWFAAVLLIVGALSLLQNWLGETFTGILGWIVIAAVAIIMVVSKKKDYDLEEELKKRRRSRQ